MSDRTHQVIENSFVKLTRRIRLLVVERPIVLTVSQVIEWVAQAHARADAVVVCPVMCLVCPITFLTER
jgi:hypothetical protein